MSNNFTVISAPAAPNQPSKDTDIFYKNLEQSALLYAVFAFLAFFTASVTAACGAVLTTVVMCAGGIAFTIAGAAYGVFYLLNELADIGSDIHDILIDVIEEEREKFPEISLQGNVSARGH